MGRSFTSAVKDAAATSQGLEYPFDFELDGEKIFYRKPTEGEGLMLSAAVGAHVPKAEKMGKAVDLFARVLHPDQKDRIVRMIFDNELGPKELFGTAEEPGILEDMLEEWGGRPIKR